MSFPKNYALPSFVPFENAGSGRELRTDATTADLQSIAATFHAEFFSEHADTEIFTHLVKMLLAKIYDERNTKNGHVYSFQVKQLNGREESAARVAERVEKLYVAAYKSLVDPDADDHIDTSVFGADKIKSAVKGLQSISVSAGAALNGDLIGAFFETIMRVGFKQDKGMYFTHANLVWFMLEALDVKGLAESKWKSASADVDRVPRVIDPSSGSGAFLIRAMRLITAAVRDGESTLVQSGQERSFFDTNFSALRPNAWAKDHLFGIDPKFVMAMTARVNMVLHGDGSSQIVKQDGLASFDKGANPSLRPAAASKRSVPASRYSVPVSEHFDVVVSNPPFGVTLPAATKKALKNNFTLPATTSSEGLFLERYAQLLRPGGRLGVVLPESLLNSSENRTVREFLFRFFTVRAVVSLPRNLFIETPTLVSLLFAQKKTETEIAAWDDAISKADVAFGNALAVTMTKVKRMKSPQTAREVFDEFAAGMSLWVPADSFVVLRGRNATVISLNAPSATDAVMAIADLKKLVNSAGFRNIRANSVLRTVAAALDATWPTYEVDEVGYKISKRGERSRPNQLMKFVDASGTEVPNLQLNSETARVSIDTKNPTRVLDYLRKDITWI